MPHIQINNFVGFQRTIDNIFPVRILEVGDLLFPKELF